MLLRLIVSCPVCIGNTPLPNSEIQICRHQRRPVNSSLFHKALRPSQIGCYAFSILSLPRAQLRFASQDVRTYLDLQRRAHLYSAHLTYVFTARASTAFAIKIKLYCPDALRWKIFIITVVGRRLPAYRSTLALRFYY